MWGHIVARCRQAGFALVEFQRRELPGQWIIMIIATTVVSVWVFTKPIVFTQDTFTYMERARELGDRATPTIHGFLSFQQFYGPPR
jgi:hypothetical protein